MPSERAVADEGSGGRSPGGGRSRSPAPRKGRGGTRRRLMKTRGIRVSEAHAFPLLRLCFNSIRALWRPGGYPPDAQSRAVLPGTRCLPPPPPVLPLGVDSRAHRHVLAVSSQSRDGAGGFNTAHVALWPVIVYNNKPARLGTC